MHLEDLADALLLTLGRVDQLRTRVSLTRVNADVGQSPEERVNRNLERERGERLGRIRVALDDLLFIANVASFGRRHVERAGQVVDDSIEHRLDATVLEGRTTENRVDLAVDSELADGLLDFGHREVGVTLHEAPEERVVSLSDDLEQRGAVLVGLVDQVGRDLFDGVLGAHLDVTLGVSAPRESAHLNQVNDALEAVLETNRKLDDQWLGTEALDDGVDGEVEVGAELVHLVDEADARNVVLVGLAPDGL